MRRAVLNIAHIIAMLAFQGVAFAENTPCSGKKGGVAHCRGNLFVCQDGSTSGSKKDCRTYEGGRHDADKADQLPSEKAKTK